MTGTTSRTARVSPARRNLQEAVSKLPTRGIRAIYEAPGRWAGGIKTLTRPSSGAEGRIFGGYMGGKSRALPWEIC
jgi:hypothetical protein